MKKILLFLFVFLFTTSYCYAETYKIIGEVVEGFSTENPSYTFKVKLMEDVSIAGINLSSSEVMQTQVTDVSKPKRGKLNATMKVTISGTDLTAKVVPYSETALDKKEAALDAGTFVAGKFVDNVALPINFARGAIESEAGKSRIASGVNKMYKKSMLSYVEKGQHLTFNSGDKVILIIKLD